MALARITSFTCDQERVGHNSIHKATMPVVAGQAMEVPCITPHQHPPVLCTWVISPSEVLYLVSYLLYEEITPQPGAAISGLFKLVLSPGPIREKAERVPTE